MSMPNHAVTHYRTIETKRRALDARSHAGKRVEKNQIRAHLSEAGHPVAGDKIVRRETNPLGRPRPPRPKLLGLRPPPTTGKHLVFTQRCRKDSGVLFA